MKFLLYFKMKYLETYYAILRKEIKFDIFYCDLCQ